MQEFGASQRLHGIINQSDEHKTSEMIEGFASTVQRHKSRIVSSVVQGALGILSVPRF